MSTNELRARLTKKLAVEAADVDHFDAIYRGKAGLGFIDPQVKRLYGDRVKTLNINHAATAVNPVAQRLQVAGFRTPAGDLVDENLTAQWRALNLPAYSAMGHVEAMVSGRAHFMVWAVDGRPVVTPESPRQVTVLRDPVTQQPIAALKRYRAEDGHTISVVMTPDVIDTYAGKAAMPTDAALDLPIVLGEDAVLVDSQRNPLGRVPVVTLVNQPRIDSPDGRSDIADIEDLLAGVGKLASDMMVASEANAIPHRIITTEASISAEQAQEISERFKVSMAKPAGAHIGVLGGGGDLKELTTASLDNFDRAIKLLVSQIASVAGLPPYFVSADVVNPTSADAIRAAESRLTARTVERQRWYGLAYAELMRLVALARDGMPDDRLADLQVLWVDPAPASIGQEADAVTKLYQSGVIDRRAALAALDTDPLEAERILTTDPVITA